MGGLQPLEQALLLQVARGKPPLGQDTLKMLRSICGVKLTIRKVRTALENLKRAGILAKPAGNYLIEDRLFAEYLGGREG